MKQLIQTHLPHLTQTQLTGLAWWVCGAILAGSACQNAVAAALSTRGNWHNLHQYLREWLYDGSDRPVPARPNWRYICFVPLLRWVLAWWRSERLALAVEPTSKKRSVANVIPFSTGAALFPWPGTSAMPTSGGPGWRCPIVELLRELAPAVPREMTGWCCATGASPVRNCGSRYALTAGTPT